MENQKEKKLSKMPFGVSYVVKKSKSTTPAVASKKIVTTSTDIVVHTHPLSSASSSELSYMRKLDEIASNEDIFATKYWRQSSKRAIFVNEGTAGGRGSQTSLFYPMPVSISWNSMIGKEF